MTPEVAIYLYGFACGAAAIVIARIFVKALSRWLSREDAPEYQGEHAP